MVRKPRNAMAISMRPTWDHDLNWQSAARCRNSDATVFFAPTHLETKDERVQREGRAKAICSECGVRRACLDFAIVTRESHGIWGGLNEIERRHAVTHQAV